MPPGPTPKADRGENAVETHLIPIALKAATAGNPISIFGTDHDTPDGTCIRDYIHVTDLVRAHILALEKLMAGKFSGIYNMGNGNGYSVAEVIEGVHKLSGRDIEVSVAERRPGDPAASPADVPARP